MKRFISRFIGLAKRFVRKIKNSHLLLVVSLLLIVFLEFLLSWLTGFQFYLINLIAAILLVAIVSIRLLQKKPRLRQLRPVSFDAGNFTVPKKGIKKVSVAIPNYNYARFLPERIESIISQTYPIYELIILDDASSDDSSVVISDIVDQLKETRKDLPIIRVISNKKNSGNAFNQWGKAFEEAKGDYLWIAEADDLSSKHFLCAVMEGFSKNKQAIISCTESRTIDEAGREIAIDSRDWSGLPYKSFCMDGKKFIAKHLSIKNTIVNVSGVVFKRTSKVDFHTLLTEARKFNNVGDWYFYEKILTKGDIAYNAAALNKFRIHSSSVTRSSNHASHFNEILKMQNVCAKDVSLPAEIVRQKQEYLVRQKNDWQLSGDEVFYDQLNLETLIKKEKISNDEMLLSVIIPVYNTSDYVERCLKSVVTDLPCRTEILVIDDGSTDNSKEIVKRFEKQYESITYIYQKHGGLPVAEQNGLKHAKGRYVIFLDSDDYIAAGAYKMMLKKALREQADIVCCDFCVIFPNGEKMIRKAISGQNTGSVFAGVSDCPLMASFCNKMIKRAIYQEISFPKDAVRYEDVAVTPLVLAKAKNISYLGAPFYNYALREKSMNSSFDESVYDIFEIVEKSLQDLKSVPIETRAVLEQSLIIHQLIAPILCWRIAELRDPSQQKQEIINFCTKYNKCSFEFENGEIIARYLLENGRLNLIELIHQNSYDEIVNMI